MPIITGLGAHNDGLYDEDQTYLAGRQSNIPAADKTVAIPAERIVRDVKTSITNATAAIQTAQDTADAAIPLTQKGAANGVATLDASGKVPASQLTVVATAFKGNWNATTNSPTLSDGTGTGGDFYFVQSGTSRNLGSGAVTWTTGAIIIHNGTAWVENEATNDVVSVNGLVGVVDLDADDIDETATRAFVLPDEAAALTASLNTLDAANPVVSRSELDAAIATVSSPGVVVVGNIYSPHNYDDGTNTSGTGELKLLSSLGYTNGSAAIRWPLAATHYGGTIDVTSTSLDDVIWACAAEGARGGIITQIEALPNKAYAFNRGGIRFRHYKSSPNNNRDSQQYTLDLKDCLYRNASGSPFTNGIFYYEPDDQTDADTNCIDNKIKIVNAKFRGVSSTDRALKVGASRSPLFQNLEFQNYQYGFQGGFLLNALFVQCNTTSGSTAGILLDRGWWSGAGYGNSVNQATFLRCRFRTTSSTQTGLMLKACDSTAVRDCEFEGTAGDYAIYIEVASSGTVLKNITLNNNRFEMGGGNKYSSAVIGYSGRDTYTVNIDTGFMQAAQTNSTLLSAENTQGTTVFILSNWRGNTGGNTWKILNRNNGGAGAYIFRNTQLQGNPTTAAEVIDTDNFPDIWVSGSDVPPLSRIDFIRCMA